MDTPFERTNWWMKDALAADPGEPTPRLRGDREADVLIIGGGYTGLWSAYALKKADPSLEVVLLEAGIVGGGPSGRNGGFLNDHWEDAAMLEQMVGSENATRAAELSARAIGAIGDFCTEHDVDAWYTPADHIGISTSPTQDGAWSEQVAAATRLGGGHLFAELSNDEVRKVADSPVFRDGVAYKEVAMIQPARLVRGLRKAVMGLGVRLYEETPVLRFRPGSPVEAETPAGIVRAKQAILGVNAWAAGWSQFKRTLLPRGTYIVLTEPAPERLEEIGWTGGEGLFDLRPSLHYVRTTPDGRIAFGGASSRAGLGTGMGPRMWDDPASYARLTEDLHRWFPNFTDVKIEAAWGGPVDVSGTHIPMFGTLPGGTVHYAHGFTGGGVGPCWMAGQILSGLARGVDDEFTRHPLVGVRGKRFPPEPFLSVGAFVTHEAIVRTDDAEDKGKRPNPLLKLIARIPRKLGFNLGA